MSKSLETRLLNLGNEKIGENIYPESPAIYQTSSFIIKDLDELYQSYEVEDFTYSRLSNPNRSQLSDVISFLEKGNRSLIFSSGMGAITTALFTVLRSGDHVICNSKLYGETTILLKEILSEYGIEADFVDFNNKEELQNGIKSNTKLLYTEIISNPLTSIVDIREIVQIARENNLRVIVDNTFTTPFLISPLEYGVDMVINSLTKSLNGHFDITAGSLTMIDEDLFKRAEKLFVLFGATLDPNSAWLAIRGIRTAELRIEKQNQNAIQIANVLEKHPKINKVFHPSLSTHPQHNLAKEIIATGNFGSIVSFEIEDSYKLMNTLIKNFKLIKYVNTLGGYKTTVSHPCSSSHYGIEDAERRKVGIHYGILRISCGIEKAKDLIYDLTQAINCL
ncbi:MAG: hypothetical protein ATN32_08315 [Candidatus Epulonipiscium fishelsonii]|nr:MAG: hypothetical protein ATN32_08315 [Epulopiscium sp. AS2M-Bin002]